MKRFRKGGGADLPDYDSPDFSGVSFKEAFAKARGGPNVKTPKNKTFMWNGTKFSTETKEEEDVRKATAAAKKPDESAAETARLRRQVGTEPEPKAEPKAGPTAREKSDARMARLEEKAKAAGSDEAIINLMPAGSALKMARAAGENIAARAAAPKDLPKAFKKREPVYESKADVARRPRDMDEARFADEGNPNFKRGGKVKKMASGGSVNSASRRGDGIAQRGKTKGRMR
jgi:hypothetical protein